MTKKCGKCQQHKEASEFNKSKQGTFGLHGHCRSCQKIVKSLYYAVNRDKECRLSREYAKSEKSKQARKKRYEANKEVLLERNRVARRTPRARALARIARKKLYYRDVGFRIAVNSRKRMREALNGRRKSQSTMKLLGCSVEELKVHIESLFQDGMTWDNYGFHGWHIDHIVPCASFDLSLPEEQAKCFHHTNLQPLWCFDNLSKGCKASP